MTSFAIAPTPPTAQCSSVVANDGPLKLQQLPRTTTSPRRHSSTIPMASIFGQEPPPPSASSKAVMALLSGTGTGTSLHAVKRKRSKYILRHDYRNSSHGIISNPSKPTMIPLTELFTRSIVWILFDSLTNNEYQDNNTPSSDDSSSRVPLLPSTSQEVNNSNQQDGLPLVPLLPLPIWPGLNTLLPPVPPESPESDFPSSQFLDLLGLFEIHPIASAIASYLYGHDLRNLRLLNSDFRNLISLGTSEAGYPLYFQVLLMKTLSCPRKGTDTEPIGRPCEDTGGNVGPCILCSTIVCSRYGPPNAIDTSVRVAADLQAKTCVAVRNILGCVDHATEKTGLRIWNTTPSPGFLRLQQIVCSVTENIHVIRTVVYRNTRSRE
ncbi:hypothetical protein BZA77DRAFT_56393 [Pyronema omphalodes]|nr:hypothetical protein BZA77DRAFT_56393 [Pyronema omphalodes]